MKKFLIFLICSLFTPLLFGYEVFVHQPGKKDGAMCQAVRIKDGWFMTAAHCVLPQCQFADCKAEIPPGIETPKQNIYFFNEAQTNNARYDIALINFNTVNKLPFFREQKILIIKNANFNEPKILNKRLRIYFSLGNNAGQISSQGTVFYGPKHKIIYTGEFGLFHGLSGAGVMTDNGELISIVSAVAGQGGSAKFSVFSVFDERVESFLRSKIPGLTFTYLDQNDFIEADEKANKEAFSLDNSK